MCVGFVMSLLKIPVEKDQEKIFLWKKIPVEKNSFQFMILKEFYWNSSGIFFTINNSTSFQWNLVFSSGIRVEFLCPLESSGIPLGIFYGEALERPRRDHTVIVPSLQRHIEITRISQGACSVIVPWLCDRCVFSVICVPNVYNYPFLIEMALQTCKTKYSMRQRHQLSQTLTHRKQADGHGAVAVRLPHDVCSIYGSFYGHCTGTVLQPCDSCAGAVRLSQEPTVSHLVIFLFQNDHLKSCVLLTITVRCLLDASTKCLQSTGLRFFICCIMQS